MTAAILDHLWQSTLLVPGVALLTLAFRRAAAAVRYGLWFAASAKFLIPFAALAALGRFLAPAVRSPVHTSPEAVFIGQATHPFSQSFTAVRAVYAAPHFDPTPIIVAVWALGCAAVLIGWMVRWARVHSIVRSAIPLAWPGHIPVLASSSLLEPGLVGLWRPVLLVPKTLPDHLAQPEIDAIVAHEACHLRRRDNLTAACHMLVEALFWFHPLVWWIGARLIEERERACDEAVVQSGHNRATYARSLVECCKLYLRSPLPCVAGASGSNLKKRVEMIMTAPPSSPLSASKKTLLLAAGICALASPVAAGLLTSPAAHQAAERVPAPSSVSTRAGEPRQAGPMSAAISAPRKSGAIGPIMLARADASSTLEASAPPSAEDIPAPRSEPTQPGPVKEDAGRRVDTSPAVIHSAEQQAPPTKQIISAPGVGGATANPGKPLESDCYIVFGELRCGQTAARGRH